MFVCTAGNVDAVLGFYTLSALAVDLASLPEALSRKLPRHPVPCALIGRLAVDRSAHGRGIGRMLLADAVKRVVAAGETVAMHALIVDAANEDAKRFYENFGFAPLTDDPMRLFLPLGHTALRGSTAQAGPAIDAGIVRRRDSRADNATSTPARFPKPPGTTSRAAVRYAGETGHAETPALPRTGRRRTMVRCEPPKRSGRLAVAA